MIYNLLLNLSKFYFFFFFIKMIISRISFFHRSLWTGNYLKKGVIYSLSPFQYSKSLICKSKLFLIHYSKPKCNYCSFSSPRYNGLNDLGRNFSMLLNHDEAASKNDVLNLSKIKRIVRQVSLGILGITTGTTIMVVTWSEPYRDKFTLVCAGLFRSTVTLITWYE